MDVAKLLQAFDGPLPCGEDMSFSAEFDAILEARRADDSSLDQGEWVTSIKDANWPQVVKLCTDLLETRTKDMRVAGWLCEALAKTEGLEGFASGAEVFAGLVEVFWGELNPRSDGDEEERIGNLSWFVGRGKQLLGEFALVRSKGEAAGLTALVGARELQKQMDRNPDEAMSLAQGRLTLQHFRELQRATPRSFYQAQLAGAARARAALTRFAAAVDARLGLEGPSFSPLHDALEAYADELERIAREVGVGGAPASATSASPAVEEAALALPGALASVASGGPLRSREQALAQLREVANFFRSTEPHSPVAYLADKAARWGEMPLHVWLKAVLKEQGAMARFEDLLGLDEPEDGAT